MKMRLTKGGFSIIPEGTYVFKITGVDMSDYEKYGRLVVNMVTKVGQTHAERFTLTTNKGEVNEGAMKAFSYFAHTALNDYSIVDFDTDDLIGRYIRAEIVHRVSDRINENTGKPYVNVNLGDKEPATGFDGVSSLDDELDDLEEIPF